MSELVAEKDLARARVDPVFRQSFLADHLDRLLEALNRGRKANDNSPEHARRMREGVELAMKLADRLQSDGHGPGPQAA